LRFVYLLGQILGFLGVFPLINMIELITEIEDLAIGLGLSLITSYDTEDRLCQFGSIGRLTLRIQRYGADGQNRNCQQPIHNALVACRKPSSGGSKTPVRSAEAIHLGNFFRRQNASGGRIHRSIPLMGRGESGWKEGVGRNYQQIRRTRTVEP
jgi:hypothetical protein